MRTIRRMLTLIALALALLAPVAGAGPLKSGAEFELTRPDLQDAGKWGLSGQEAGAALELAVAAERACRPYGARVEIVEGAWLESPDFLFTFPDGLWFKIGVAPWVVEVQTRP